MQPQQDGQAPQKPFRFLELPLEIRNAIYNIILCAPPPPNVIRIGQRGFLPDPIDMTYIRYPLEAQILSTNRQVHAEACDTMLRGNQFIRIRGDKVPKCINTLVRKAQLPVMLTATIPSATAKGIVMTHTLEWHESAPPHLNASLHDRPNKIDWVILRRDLDAFCEALALRGFYYTKGFGNVTKHVLEVHNPFEDTLSPDFMGEDNQQRLLHPYREHLRGFSHLSVQGHVSPGLAKSIQVSVAEVLPIEPEQVIGDMRRQKDLGNGAFRRRLFHEASGAYRSGLCGLRVTMNGTLWRDVKARGGPAFLHALAEVYHQIHLNLAQSILTYLQEGSNGDPGNTKSFADTKSLCSRAEAHVTRALVRNAKRKSCLTCPGRRGIDILVLEDQTRAHSSPSPRRTSVFAYGRPSPPPPPFFVFSPSPFPGQKLFILTGAQNAPDHFQTDWRPTLAQLAKANYRMALVKRAQGETDRAKVFIDTARLQSPNDPIIRMEAEAIEDAMRAQAGLGRLLR